MILINELLYKRGAHGYIYVRLNGEWRRSTLSLKRYEDAIKARNLK